MSVREDVSKFAPLTSTSLLCYSVPNLITLYDFSSATDTGKIKISIFLDFLFIFLMAHLYFFPPHNSIFGFPFTVLHDVQLRPCGADKAVGHQGSSRWCLVTRPWCFLQSSNHCLKGCGDRAELTAESCNYFQVAEKCHSHKTVGILP